MSLLTCTCLPNCSTSSLKTWRWAGLMFIEEAQQCWTRRSITVVEHKVRSEAMVNRVRHKVMQEASSDCCCCSGFQQAAGLHTTQGFAFLNCLGRDFSTERGNPCSLNPSLSEHSPTQILNMTARMIPHVCDAVPHISSISLLMTVTAFLTSFSHTKKTKGFHSHASHYLVSWRHHLSRHSGTCDKRSC